MTSKLASAIRFKNSHNKLYHSFAFNWAEMNTPKTSDNFEQLNNSVLEEKFEMIANIGHCFQAKNWSIFKTKCLRKLKKLFIPLEATKYYQRCDT